METPTGIAALLASGTELFKWVMTCLGSVITTITGNPILLLGFLMALCGFVIGITRRLMNLSQFLRCVSYRTAIFIERNVMTVYIRLFRLFIDKCGTSSFMVGFVLMLLVFWVISLCFNLIRWKL